MTILTIKDVSKTFGTQTVLNQLNFAVKENQVIGFIGRNGAGKTTLMKMIVGLLEIDSGEIAVNGQRVLYGDHQTNQVIGYLPDVPEFYPYMTAKEYLTLCGEITQLTKTKIQQKTRELLSLVGLADNQKKIHTYSRGMKQRLGIAQALLNEPRLLICDEPTSALDPIGREEILTILTTVKKQTTVIFSTHVLGDVEKICDHIILLDEGSIKIDLPMAELKNKYAFNRLSLSFAPDVETEHIMNLFADLHLIQGAGRKEFYLEGSQLAELQKEVYRRCLAANLFPECLTIAQGNLGDIFAEVVK